MKYVLYIGMFLVFLSILMAFREAYKENRRSRKNKELLKLAKKIAIVEPPDETLKRYPDEEEEEPVRKISERIKSLKK